MLLVFVSSKDIANYVDTLHMKKLLAILFLLSVGSASAEKLSLVCPGGVKSTVSTFELNGVHYISRTDLDGTLLPAVKKSGYEKIDEIRVVPGSFFIIVTGGGVSKALQIYSPVIRSGSTDYVPFKPLLTALSADNDISFDFSKGMVEINHSSRKPSVAKAPQKVYTNIKSLGKEKSGQKNNAQNAISEKEKSNIFLAGFNKRAAIFRQALISQDQAHVAAKGIEKPAVPASELHNDKDYKAENSTLREDKPDEAVSEGAEYNSIQTKRVRISDKESIEAVEKEIQPEPDNAVNDENNSEAGNVSAASAAEDAGKADHLPDDTNAAGTDTSVLPDQSIIEPATGEKAPDGPAPETQPAPRRITIGSSSSPMPGMKLPDVSSEGTAKSARLRLTPNRYVIPKSVKEGNK